MGQRVIETENVDDLVRYGPYIKKLRIRVTVEGTPITLDWFDECVVRDESSRCSRAELYRSFSTYAGDQHLSQKRFFGEFRRMATWSAELKSGPERFFTGVRLR